VKRGGTHASRAQGQARVILAGNFMGQVAQTVAHAGREMVTNHTRDLRAFVSVGVESTACQPSVKAGSERGTLKMLACWRKIRAGEK
jgi:hypothetical protein